MHAAAISHHPPSSLHRTRHIVYEVHSMHTRTDDPLLTGNRWSAIAACVFCADDHASALRLLHLVVAGPEAADPRPQGVARPSRVLPRMDFLTCSTFYRSIYSRRSGICHPIKILPIVSCACPIAMLGTGDHRASRNRMGRPRHPGCVCVCACIKGMPADLRLHV